MAYLDIFAGQVEQGQSLLQVVGEKRDTKQIGGRALVVSPRGFGAQFVPILNRAVAAPKPCQSHEIDLSRDDPPRQISYYRRSHLMRHSGRFAHPLHRIRAP